MGAETNKLLTGDYDHVGDTIVYGDTDCIFAHEVSKKQGIELDMDSAITLYDTIRDASK